LHCSYEQWHRGACFVRGAFGWHPPPPSIGQPQYQLSVEPVEPQPHSAPWDAPLQFPSQLAASPPQTLFRLHTGFSTPPRIARRSLDGIERAVPAFKQSAISPRAERQRANLSVLRMFRPPFSEKIYCEKRLGYSRESSLSPRTAAKTDYRRNRNQREKPSNAQQDQ
jgi:hypothetical protein